MPGLAEVRVEKKRAICSTLHYGISGHFLPVLLLAKTLGLEHLEREAQVWSLLKNIYIQFYIQIDFFYKHILINRYIKSKKSVDRWKDNFKLGNYFVGAFKISSKTRP